MKKNNIALLILVISLTLVGSYFVMNAIFGNSSQNTVKVERVQRISSEVPAIDRQIFNERAIDPSVVIEIGNPSNQQPFK